MRYLLGILLVLLTIYAPVELTRVIIAYGLSAELIFEIAFMWTFYIGGITLMMRLLIF